ncbi:MAG: 7-carboxy-7-deazaguanine synthase QueE [Candidatus Omnitrophica bacterium]|jgi:organic radical activating enzyme|nr:7-carboxy-7-deazaguanine synthase QueE [Candidatus Omnitrophota bacterium]
MRGKVSEVFGSIQGEGIYLGEKQIFVRFFGCNLSCRFCDTKLDSFKEYDPQELFEEIKFHHDDYHSVAFTGGEPLLQKDFLKEILYSTCCYGYKTYLETNGTLTAELEDVIEYLDIVAMDLKFPTSTGVEKHFWQEHRDFLKVASRKQVFLKGVICESTSEEDLNEALDLIKECDKSAVLVLQPNSLEDSALLSSKLRHFKQLCRKENIASCVIPQMHKIIGVR